MISGDLLTVEDLLYGMMLPSGNDAANALALYFGVLLMYKGKFDPNVYLRDVSSQ